MSLPEFSQVRGAAHRFEHNGNAYESTFGRLRLIEITHGLSLLTVKGGARTGYARCPASVLVRRKHFSHFSFFEVDYFTARLSEADAYSRP